MSEKFARAAAFTDRRCSGPAALSDGLVVRSGPRWKRLLAVETGLWPLKEAINGVVTRYTYIPKRKPVEAYSGNCRDGFGICSSRRYKRRHPHIQEQVMPTGGWRPRTSMSRVRISVRLGVVRPARALRPGERLRRTEACIRHCVTPAHLPDVRTPIPLGAEARQEHRAVMLQHLETIQAIGGLGGRGSPRAQGLTETHLILFYASACDGSTAAGEFLLRPITISRWRIHAAAEQLADVMPTTIRSADPARVQ
ncbi:MAG: hypothetical protein MRJ92_01480 [Nitrospira sp.]|nr:hypothetical protein [Nitrospira sp.]